MMKAGFTRRALILPTASSSVPSALGLAGLSKPTWLSLICRKVRPLASADAAPVVVIRSHRQSPLKPSSPPRHQIADERDLFPGFLGCVCLQIALPEIAARPIHHNAVMPVETLYWEP